MSQTIHKAGAIVIQDSKLLLSRSKGKDVFVCPGGKLEADETAEQALIRELQEEQGITVNLEDLEFFGSYEAIAAGHEQAQTQLLMDVYLVKRYTGTLSPQAEIAENLWFDTGMKDAKHGSIFKHKVIPRLKRQNLID
jgi:8-oxo-dGTP diphosphatase